MQIVLAILASYRIAYLVSRERGPFDLAERLRGFVIQKYGEDSWQGTGIDCPLCVSFWVSLVMPFAPRFIRKWLGIAGGVLVIHLVIDALALAAIGEAVEQEADGETDEEEAKQ